MPTRMRCCRQQTRRHGLEVAHDEDVFDLRVDDVTSLRVTDLWYFSYQVLKPGDTGTERPR